MRGRKEINFNSKKKRHFQKHTLFALFQIFVHLVDQRFQLVPLIAGQTDTFLARFLYTVIVVVLANVDVGLAFELAD